MIERIASGLNQPTYLTQAPGDPANILYFTERTSNTIAGFNAVNEMGKVWRYDIDTRSKELVLDLSDRTVFNDTGLLNIAFHPDFNNSGTAGHQKMYVTLSERGPTAVNKVEEYTVGPGGTASFSRLILQYDNNRENNHTVNWAAFDPTATGAERNYLYISTGDGSFGSDYNDGTSPTGRPSQNPNDLQGKMLRVDVSGGDDYPEDPLKNFAIPPSNPIPAHNAANPGSPISGLGEVWLTGLRNVFRASFDRETGDLWMGDVGEVAIESVNFLKADSNASGPPVDYGWPQWEGTQVSPVAGIPNTTTNPFTGAVSMDPVQQYPRLPGGNAVIGGYLYRGPIAELQGKYFYADFVRTGDSNQIFALDFDRDTDPNDFNGDNGTVTDVTALWQSLVFDPTDPTYQPSTSPLTPDGLDHIVSFGEDNAGNLYIVDFGNGTGFTGQYPPAGRGEIFRLTPAVNLKLTVSRDTGEIVLENLSGADIELSGYSLTSLHGGIDPGHLLAISDSIDPGQPWQTTSPGDSPFQFAEETTGDLGTIPAGAELVFGQAGAWIQSIFEDFRFSITLPDGTDAVGSVAFVGNGGEPFHRSDLNFDGTVDAADWQIFRAHHLALPSGLSPAQAYALGDLTGDGANGFEDFRLFQADFIAAHGEAAFAALLQNHPVPEPGTLVLALAAAGALLMLRARPGVGAGGRKSFAGRRCHAGRPLLVLATTASLGVLASTAPAALRHQYTFIDGTASDSVGSAHGTLEGDASIDFGTLLLPGGAGDDGHYLDLPASVIDIASYTDATFEAWFTWDGTGGAWQRVFDFGRTVGFGPSSGQGRDYIFYTPNSGAGDTRAAISMSGSNPFPEDVAVGGPSAPAGTPLHVAVVVDSATNGGTGRLSLYLDGTLSGDVELTNELSGVSNSQAYLGRSMWAPDALFAGQIDEFRIYDHALGGVEIMESFAAGPTPMPTLGLQVNAVTGRVHLVNQHPLPLSFDYYRITSSAGALNPAGWTSLDDQNADAVGPEPGQSWDAFDVVDPSKVGELFLLGATQLGPGEDRELGQLFDPSQFGLGADGDLQFEFAIQGGGLVEGGVTYVVPDPLDGDYNDNGVVDAADFTLWRDTLGSTSELAADGDGDGVITDADYAVWKWSFGSVAAGASSGGPALVPEATSASLLVAGLLGGLLARIRRGRHDRRGLNHLMTVLAVWLASSAIAPMAVAEEKAVPVTIRVDAGDRRGELEPIWRFFGADEPNYAYMKDGKKLLAELGELRPGEVYFRTHNLLNSGDGTPALKWGSSGAYREDADGNPRYDWTILDRIFTTYLERGVRPYVQIGFMPKELSSRPQPYQHQWSPGARYEEIYTGWAYPPNDYGKWEELVYQWATHCVETYGREEVERWYWQTWNEPNIGYWQGTPQEFHKLHDHAIAAVRRALPTARVGGPDVAGHGGQFMIDFLEHCFRGTNYATGQTGTPLDFVAFHAKGRPEHVEGHVRMGIDHHLRTIDEGFRLVASFAELKGTPVVIGESDPEGCAACQGPHLHYRNTTMYSSYTAASFARKLDLAERHGVHLEGVLTWAFQFEDQPYFAGFRVLASNGINLPVMNVFRMFARMSGERIAVDSDAAVSVDQMMEQGVRDRADVSALASLDDDKLSVLVWHYHDDDVPGPAAEVSLHIEGLPAMPEHVSLRRFQIDAEHSNAYTTWQRMGEPQQPTADQYAELEQQGQLAEIDPPDVVHAGDSAAELRFRLPRQGVTLIHLDRASPGGVERP